MNSLIVPIVSVRTKHRMKCYFVKKKNRRYKLKRIKNQRDHGHWYYRYYCYTDEINPIQPISISPPAFVCFRRNFIHPSQTTVRPKNDPKNTVIRIHTQTNTDDWHNPCFWVLIFISFKCSLWNSKTISLVADGYWIGFFVLSKVFYVLFFSSSISASEKNPDGFLENFVVSGRKLRGITVWNRAIIEQRIR